MALKATSKGAFLTDGGDIFELRWWPVLRHCGKDTGLEM